MQKVKNLNLCIDLRKQNKLNFCQELILKNKTEKDAAVTERKGANRLNWYSWNTGLVERNVLLLLNPKHPTTRSLVVLNMFFIEKIIRESRKIKKKQMYKKG